MPPLRPEGFPLPVLADAAPTCGCGCGCHRGPAHWRSLEEKRGTAVPRAEEFPPGATEPPEGLARRSFLQLLGASMALAGLEACFQTPGQKIMPYGKQQPPELTPGNPLHYATAGTLGGYATGWVVRSSDGRPTKIEGNPAQPESLGATTPLDQAELLQLYDPQRPAAIKHRGALADRGELVAGLAELAVRHAADGGARLRFLLEPNASPLLADLRARILRRFPNARLQSYAPLSRDQRYEGARLALGRPLETLHALSGAKVVVSLDDDFLSGLPGNLRRIREYTDRREPGPDLSRLYVVESQLSLTGGFADHRLRVRPSEVLPFARALAAALAAEGVAELGQLPAPPSELPADRQKWVRAVARDLARGRGASLVMVGERQPPAVHALAHAMNAALGNVGRTLRYVAPGLDTASGPGSLATLARELAAGAVDTLVVTAFDPAYTAPAELGFGGLLAKAPHVVYLGFHEDDTAARAEWFVPAAHPLESWGDARAEDGTATVVQPLILPLFKGLTEAEVLAPFAGVPDVSPHDAVKALWRARVGEPADFEARWEDWLATGVVPSTAAAEERPAVQWDAVARAVNAPPPPPSELELSFVPDLKVYDGRFANNPWLQELPDTVTQLTWDNAALVSPATAAKLGVGAGDVVRLALRGKEVEAPVWPLPGHPDGVVTVSLGYGRTRASEKVARGVGFNAYALRHSDAPWFAGGLAVTRVEGKRHAFANAQTHWTMEGRELALEKRAGELQQKPQALEHLRGEEPTLYDPFPVQDGEQTPHYRWAMAVDLTRCTGCAACVVACQAENNILVVGKEQVRKGREMHWLRIDRYFTGREDDPGTVTQPVMCQHCEKAPCEYVCPVNATVHSDEGLNEMVYNRCVGTRDCSNNCPYKVRRFNYLNYRRGLAEVQTLRFNPDVTVRSRGVMEKCTYCVQRIERARIDARVEGREIRPGEVQTACQQACPAKAITFGSLTQPEARVSQLRASDRRYDLLHELGTRPRTQYLVRIKNPNPELA